jgi:uncharacterized membrane protein
MKEAAEAICAAIRAGDYGAALQLMSSLSAQGDADARRYLIVGHYLDSTGQDVHGFLYSPNSNTYTAIDYPSARHTAAMGINNNGQIVGNYIDSSQQGHGFLLSGSTYTRLDAP